MKYRIMPKNKDKLSMLGYGCMRFPTLDGKIDQEYTNRLIQTAFQNGVNYFDTAFVYANSEVALGIALSKLNAKRKDYKIATKLPRWSVKSKEDFDKFFAMHLERLQTTYIDYYLIHCLYSFSDWKKLKELGVLEFVANKKKSGEIINIGFSFHGGYDEFCKIIDDNDWDFCMIQYNLLDEFNQATYKGIDYASNKGMAVFIMEPLKGGKMIRLMPKFVEEDLKVLNKKAGKDYSVASWGLRWVWNNPKVTLLLSGMSTDEQLQDNLNTASSFEPLSKEQMEGLKNVQQQMLKLIKVGCTGCNYCDVCPQEMEISMLMDFYNDCNLGMFSDNKATYAKRIQSFTGMDTTKCTSCRKCEKMCPQGIKIADIIKEIKTENL